MYYVVDLLTKSFFDVKSGAMCWSTLHREPSSISSADYGRDSSCRNDQPGNNILHISNIG